MVFRPEDSDRLPRPMGAVPGKMTGLSIPTKAEQEALIKLRRVMMCPRGCKITMVVNAVPMPGSPQQNDPGCGRCLVCLLFWQVDSSGKLVAAWDVDKPVADLSALTLIEAPIQGLPTPGAG